MLAIGRGLMLDPGVVLLDEATANLAPAVAAELPGQRKPEHPVTGRTIGCHVR